MSNWQETEKGFYKKFLFKNFVGAFGFMSSVAILVEKADHHPTWANTYNSVEIWLITHDQGNKITEKDFKLAQEIDNLVK